MVAKVSFFLGWLAVWLAETRLAELAAGYVTSPLAYSYALETRN